MHFVWPCLLYIFFVVLLCSSRAPSHISYFVRGFGSELSNIFFLFSYFVRCFVSFHSGNVTLREEEDAENIFYLIFPDSFLMVKFP